MKKEYFDRTAQGEEIYAYTLQNGRLSATILTYGGILQKFTVDGKDIVCGFDSYADYVSGGGSHGALIGRYANRIADAKFTLNGKTYQLEKNEKGITHLHGGENGFGVRVWEATPIDAPGYEALALRMYSPDGEGGYPGAVDVTVTYTLSEGALAVHYEAQSDADTVFNMTHHAYFNLHGYNGDSILDHTLQIDADTFTAVDARLIPTEERPVDGTPFDFRTPTPVGARIRDDYDQLILGCGYDHNFNLNASVKESLFGRELGRAAVLRADGLALSCYTDKPCLQIYSGNYMEGDTPLKGGVPLRIWHGICLETQYAPDSPNHGKAILRAGEPYDFTTVFVIE